MFIKNQILKLKLKQLLMNPKLIKYVLLLPNWLYNIIAKKSINIDPQSKMSMLSMIENGSKRTEIDHLNGYILKLSLKCKIKTPLNSNIIHLVKKAEKEGKSPKYSGNELYHLLYKKRTTNNI